MNSDIVFTRSSKVLDSDRYKIVAEADKLGFGKVFSDHMFYSQYKKSTGWQPGSLVPYQDIALKPAASALHYGQALFEGMKAFWTPSGKLRLFRIDDNFKRMRAGAERLGMIAPSEDVFKKGLESFVWSDARWTPQAPGSSLYLRPTLIANEPFLGVRPSEEYLFFIIGSPVAGYYSAQKGSASAVKIWVETKDSRTGPGGVGFVKAAGNYSASLVSAQRAKDRGFAQVLWLDACSKKYVEEVGTMNVFFVVGNEVWTPELNGRILPGVTRDSVIQILRSWDIKVIEKPVALQELQEAYDKGILSEAFGTGTAAVITPIELLQNDKIEWKFTYDANAISARLKSEIIQIQTGDPGAFAHWVQEVDPEGVPEYIQINKVP